MTALSRYVLAALFILAGMLHFVSPSSYEAIIPPGYPSPGTLVLLSGLAEVAGGIGLLVRSAALRRWAGWGLVALLVAVFPANVAMALDPSAPLAWGVPAWLLWARLPLQGVLVAWALRASGALYPGANAPGHARRASSSG